MRNVNPKTTLSHDHNQKAKMIVARLRNFVDAIDGRSRLRIGPRSIANLMTDAADLFERLCEERKRNYRTSADNVFMEKNKGKFFIRQGSILVRRAFDTENEAKNWAIENYKNTVGWTILSERSEN